MNATDCKSVPCKRFIGSNPIQPKEAGKGRKKYSQKEERIVRRKEAERRRKKESQNRVRKGEEPKKRKKNV